MFGNPTVLEGHTDRVSAVAWLDKDRLVTGSFDKTLKIWNVAEAKAERTIAAHQDHVLAVAAHGEWIASGGKDRNVKLWNANADQPAKDVAAHGKAVYSIAIDSSGKLLASCGEDDGRILLWDLAAGKALKQLSQEDPDDKNQKRSLHAIAVSPDGRQLVSGGADRTVRLWDIEAAKEMSRFEAAEYQLFTEKDNKVERATKKAASEFAIYAVAFSPDGKLVAAGGLDKTIHIWDAASGELRQTLANHPGFVYGLAFVVENRVLSVGHTGQICDWNVTSPKPVTSLKLPALAQSVALSPDGTQVAVGCINAKTYALKIT
jgi:WD40 repeat protein